MGSIIGTIAALAFLAAIVYFVVKEFKEDGDNTEKISEYIYYYGGYCSPDYCRTCL